MEAAWSTRKPATRSLLVIAAAFGALTIAGVLWLDAPIAGWIESSETSSVWNSIIPGLEWAMLLPLHPLALPIALVVGMLATAGVKRWRGAAPAWMLVTGVQLISRLSTNWIKDATGRIRPSQWLNYGAGATFGWEGGVSFPSGHVALFAGILVPLAIVAPRRWRTAAAVFAIAIVGFVSAARVAVDAHWLSDTTGAISLVALWTYLLGLAVRPVR